MANSWGIPKHIEDAVSERDLCCVYCGKKFGTERANKKSWEHIINDIRITTLSNIALCCVAGNASKGNNDLATWLHSENARKRGVTTETIADVIKVALDSE